MIKQKKCRNCKDLFTPFNSTMIVCTLECAIELKKKRNKDKSDKDFKKFKKERLPYVKATEYKKQLQKEINYLARQIDKYFNFNCVDCGKVLLKQVHGAHFHNVGGNENIRYNLHNIHSTTSQCNKYSSEHKVGYRQGIENRYSLSYLNYIDIEIPNKYKYIGLNELEVVAALKIVRKLNREFKTFKLNDGIQARDMFNKIINIYI